MRSSTAKSTKSHQCEICHKKDYGSKHGLNNHLFQHGVLKSRFKCSYCSKEFYRRDIYNWHVRRHTNEKRLYTCDHCERSFVEKRNLILHLKIHDDLFIDYNKNLNCTACGASYCERRLLDNHIRTKHFNYKGVNPNFQQKKKNETWVENEKGSKSHVEITKVHNNVLHIKKYENSNHEVENHRSNNKNNLNEYSTSIFTYISETQYSRAVCDYCKKEMVKKSLKNHIRERHLKLRKFKCEKCFENFNRHYQMVNHICGKFKRKERK